MFQIKDFPSIAASLINLMRANQAKVTDFSVGSVARTLLEAPAEEMEQLYLQMLLGLQEAIPVALYQAFAFDRLAARPATGVLRITITSSGSTTVVPAGTIFNVAGQSIPYTTLADVVIPPGATYGLTALACGQTGSGGNLEAGQAFLPASGFSAFVCATNPAPLTNGSDVETDDQRMTRFASFIASLPRGTVAAIRYGLTLVNLKNSFDQVIEVVRYSRVVEPYLADPEQPIAYVQCYIHNGVDGASSELIQRALDVLHGYYDNGVPVPGYKAAGVKVEVFQAGNLSTPVTAAVTLLDGFDQATVFQQITHATTAYLEGLDIGRAAIRAEIIALAMAVPGVYNVTVSAPATDVTLTNIQKIMPGPIILTAA